MLAGPDYERGRYEICKFSNLFVVHTEVGGEANPVSKGHFGASRVECPN